MDLCLPVGTLLFDHRYIYLYGIVVVPKRNEKVPVRGSPALPV